MSLLTLLYFLILQNPIDLMPGGVPVTGVYLSDGIALESTLVAVVPAGLRTPEPYVVPLRRMPDGSIEQDVLTDVEGGFLLPPLDPGRYFLEAILPTGRVHYSETFFVPAQEDLEEGTIMDLGTIEVEPGAVMSVWVGNAETFEPLADAWVEVKQGRGVDELRAFLRPADMGGRAELSGLNLDLAAEVLCEAPGYRPLSERLEFAPALYECLLEEWAWISGRVSNLEGEPLDAVLSAIPGAAPEQEGDEEEMSTTINRRDGTYLLRVPAGEVLLRAAAPGFQVREESMLLAPGESRDAGDFALLPGRELLFRVLDAESRESLAAVEISALDPPGAVETMTDVDGEARVMADVEHPLHLRFTTPDYVSRIVRFSPEELRPQDDLADEILEVTMEAAGWVQAVLEDAVDPDLLGMEPKRCVGCLVEVLTTGEELLTDEYGEALSGPLAPGYHRIARPQVTHLGSMVIERPRDEVRWVRVEAGEVTRLYFRRSGDEVRVIPEPMPPERPQLMASTLGRTNEYEPSSEGEYLVRRKSGELLALHLKHWDVELGTEVSVAVGTLPASGDRHILRLPETHLFGRAQTYDDRPIVHERIRLLRLDGSLAASTRTDLGGGFEVLHASPGIYSLMLGDTPLRFVRIEERYEADLGIFELPADGF